MGNSGGMPVAIGALQNIELDALLEPHLAETEDNSVVLEVRQ